MRAPRLSPRPKRPKSVLREPVIALDDARAGAVRALRRAHDMTCALARTADALRTTHHAGPIADATADAAHLAADATRVLTTLRRAA